MNWLKDQKQRIVIIISVAIILCSFSMIPLSRKTDGFPHNIWTNLGILMGMAGGGVIGLAISLRFLNRPQAICKPHENNLKRKAWKDLGVRFYSLIVGGISFYYIINHSDKMSILDSLPARIIMLSVIIVIGIWVAVGPFVMKKRLLKGLDERERLIYEKAKMISDSIFGGLSMAAFIGIFAWMGPKSPIPVFVPVLMFFALAFIAEIVKPLMILIQCKMEQASE